MHFIYKLIFPNNKVYIGQTKNIENRFRQYKSGKGHAKVGQAIEEFGWENIQTEILIECSLEEVNYNEIFYIALYRANEEKYGYNIETGGFDHRFYTNKEKYFISKIEYKPILQYNSSTGFFEKYYPNLQFAAKTLNIDVKKLDYHLRAKPITGINNKLFIYATPARPKRILYNYMTSTYNSKTGETFECSLLKLSILTNESIQNVHKKIKKNMPIKQYTSKKIS